MWRIVEVQRAVRAGVWIAGAVVAGGLLLLYAL